MTAAISFCLSRSLLLAVVLVSLTACDSALVYGERTGINIGITSDAAKATPINANIGLERQVVSIIPGKQDLSPDGKARGEATSVLSNFSLMTVPSGTGALNDSTVIGTTFVSGAAAVALVSENSSGARVAETVLGATVRGTVSDQPKVRNEQQVLVRYINESEENLRRYLTYAQSNGLVVPEGQTERARAVGAITAPENVQGNSQFLDLVN